MNQGYPEVKIIYNNYDSDTFFIKAMMLNSPQAANVYGDTSYGTSFRFVVTDLDDEKYVMTGTQNHQQAYHALQMPYTFMGIGRSNNYIETFFAATSYMGSLSQRMWTPIIPNS
jgi:integrin alpha FG-GAP repeat containing protein 1